ncbi:MAG: CapA family protein, partial [Chloroflexota bacterium]
QLDPEGYPLALGLVLRGPSAPLLAPSLGDALAPFGQRDPARLTQLIMTGVTAMCRLTADRMERYGVLYPALVISDTLRGADITHVSNEVPFIAGCQPDIRANNLTFCSDYDYWGALASIGTDLVGLSGNHVNDYGYAGARQSLAFYRERGIPIYGSGLDTNEACAPIRLEHHGNTFAFLAALAWGPASAWASDTLPGACYYYQERERILATIRGLKAVGVDVVAVELQYLETYNPFPTDQQVAEFRELRAAGADLVTGVQSHVPQAWEPYGRDDPGGPGIIVYGLGNLFFDQMWSWETRTGLIARHTVYAGKLISSEVLTTVLEDYAQPRWATPAERAEILGRIFRAAPARPR